MGIESVQHDIHTSSSSSTRTNFNLRSNDPVAQSLIRTGLKKWEGGVLRRRWEDRIGKQAGRTIIWQTETDSTR